jgi:hypothetical protein
MAPVKLKADDVIKLKKPHPCGTNEWVVVAVGMEAGLRCSNCGQIVKMSRRKLSAGFRGFIRR